MKTQVVFKKANEADLLAAIEKHGVQGAARHLGMNSRTVQRRLSRIKDREASGETATMPVPEGYVAGAVSTLHGPDGEVRLQWVKARAQDELERILKAIKAAFEDSPRVARIKAPPTKLPQHLLTVYPMGDPHLGMYAWAAETGADFDLAIAERNLVGATQRLVATTTPSHTALIANVGDFFHSDTQENRTMRSGHQLDVDSRWAKVLRVGMRTMRACIDAALKKHREVVVCNAIGNHDDHTSQMLTLGLSMLYEKNPRVRFLDSPGKFHYYLFGKNLIGITHGNTVKPEKLPLLMAADKPKEWGATRFRYWLTGHIHTRRVFEEGECLVESFRTLAARDAYAAGAGYRSGRDMYAITYHQDLGEIERHRVDIAALEAA